MTMKPETWLTTGDDRVTVWLSEDGWRWRVQASNGEIVGGGESHPDRRDAVKAALRHHPRVDEP